MDPKVLNESYENGRAAFKAGASLRLLIERFAADGGVASEQEAISLGLGFLDAAFDKLRGIER